jgi:polyhydroxyalkanoate synthase
MNLFTRSARWWDLQRRWPSMSADSLHIAPSSAETVYTLSPARLLRYHSDRRRHATPLLLIPSVINRYYIFDLRPERSLVAYLLAQGYDVWLVDWQHRGVDRYMTMDDYVTVYLRRFMRRIRRVTGSAAVSLLGYSIGGVFAMLYAALWPDEVANLVDLTGPVDFETEALFDVWTRKEHFSADTVVDATGNIPGWTIQAAFDSAVPGKNVLRALRLWERLDDEAELQHYLAVLYWLQDSVDLPGEFYRRYIRDVYQDNQLLEKRLVMDDRVVDLGEIVCPLLAIAADDDFIAPPEQVMPLIDAVGSSDKQLLMLSGEGGHIFITVGPQAPHSLWPKLDNWLSPRSYPLTIHN